MNSFFIDENLGKIFYTFDGNECHLTCHKTKTEVVMIMATKNIAFYKELIIDSFSG